PACFTDPPTTVTHTLPYPTLFRSRSAEQRHQRGPLAHQQTVIADLAVDPQPRQRRAMGQPADTPHRGRGQIRAAAGKPVLLQERSEEHTSELQSRENLVCRLLLEK